MMLCWQISMLRLVACASMATGASALAQASDDVSARTRISHATMRGNWESCGAPPERMVPMMAGMLGKPVTLASAPADVMASELKLDAAQKKRINSILDKLEKESRPLSWQILQVVR